MNIYSAVETDSTDEKKDEKAERGVYLSYDDKKPDDGHEISKVLKTNLRVGTNQYHAHNPRE